MILLNKRIGFFSLALLVLLISVSFGADTARAESASWTIGGNTAAGSTFVATFNASTNKDIYSPGETIVVNANGSVQFSGSGLIVFALIIYSDVTGVSTAYTRCVQNPFSCSASLVAPTIPGIYYVKLEGYAGSVTPNTRHLRIVVPQPLTCGPANNIPTTGTPNSSLLCSSGNATSPSLNSQTWQWSCISPTTGDFVSCSAPNIAPPTVDISPPSKAIMLGQSAAYAVTSSSGAQNMDMDVLLWQPPGITSWSNGGISSTYGGVTVTGGSEGKGYSFFNATNFHASTYTFKPVTKGVYHLLGSTRVGNTFYSSPLPGATLSVCSADQTIVNGACTTPGAPPPTPLPDLSAGATTVTPNPGTEGTLALSGNIINKGDGAAVKSSGFPNTFQIVKVDPSSTLQITIYVNRVGVQVDRLSIKRESAAPLITSLATKTTSPSVTGSHLFDSAGTYYVNLCANINEKWNRDDSVADANGADDCGDWTEVTVSSTSNQPTPTSPTPSPSPTPTPTPTPTPADACGPASGAKPKDPEPTDTEACTEGTFKANAPADPLLWNWSCGAVTTCSAPKYGCTILTDSHYNPSGPKNDYGCSKVCATKGATNYPTCTPPACTTGGPPCCAPAS